MKISSEKESVCEVRVVDADSAIQALEKELHGLVDGEDTAFTSLIFPTLTTVRTEGSSSPSPVLLLDQQYPNP